MRRRPSRAHGLAIAVAAGAAVLVSGIPSAGAATPTVTEFGAGISAGSDPTGITAGMDGNLYFTELSAHRVARIATDGTVFEFPALANNPSAAFPKGIAVDEYGDLWFTESFNSSVSRITTGGTVTRIPIPGGADRAPQWIAPGPGGGVDRSLWFTERDTDGFGAGDLDRIGELRPGAAPAVLNEFNAHTSHDTFPEGIAPGSDGRMWFANMGSTRVGAISTAGAVQTFTAGLTGPTDDITPGPDGNLWFTENTSNRIGRITTAGNVQEFTGLNAGAPRRIVAGPDGNLWFTDGTGRIGRITPAGVVTEFTAGISPGAVPNDITTGPDGALWFTDPGGEKVSRINTALDEPAFENEAEIVMPTNGADTQANPYPTTIDVSGLQGTVTEVRARLTGLAHPFPVDVDVLLVGPQGQSAILTADSGGTVPVGAATLNIRDSGPFDLLNDGPLVSGIFRPTNHAGGDIFPAPAPPGPHAGTLATFNGTDPNGTWRLFVTDDSPGQDDGGGLRGGWGLDIQTTGPPAGPPPGGTTVPPSNALTLGKLKRNKKKGIAFLTVTTPGPGELALDGTKGIKDIGGAGIARAAVSTPGGETRLKIKPGKGKKAKQLKRRLKAKGKAKRKVRVTFLPTGGVANTVSRKVKLVRK